MARSFRLCNAPTLASSWPGLSRPSTSCLVWRREEKKDVDARDKRGHDARHIPRLHVTALARELGQLLTDYADPTLLVSTQFSLAVQPLQDLECAAEVGARIVTQTSNLIQTEDQVP